MKTMNETVKASHLMVGDYVKWEYVTYPDVVVNNGYKKVDAIYGDESVDLIDEDTLYEHVPMDEIKSVELTAEILEKNFKNESNIFELQTYKLNENFNLEDRGDRFCLVRKCSDYNSSTFWICDLTHLHQLQHALRLCGIKQEITI